MAGLFWGTVGVVAFSITLPATRIAVEALGAFTVGAGRAVAAALIALLILVLRRERFPRAQFPRLLLVISGVVLGFPWLSAWALTRLPAAHGAVMLALLPLTTAGAGTLLARERPSLQFWLASLLGCAAVLGYAWLTGAGSVRPADLALVGAVVLAALGYAVGGQLAQEMGGWKVISWALVLALPLTLPPALISGLRVDWAAAPWGALLGFLYVALVSQFSGFFAWYHGLALGGVARVGQLQYLQVFLTLFWSALLLHEQITWLSIAAALLAVLSVAWGRRAPVRRAVPVSADAPVAGRCAP